MSVLRKHRIKKKKKRKETLLGQVHWHLKRTETIQSVLEGLG